MKKNRALGRKGTVFISTLICTFLMVLTAGYLFDLISQDFHQINRLQKATQAQLLAEAGLHATFSTLQSDWTKVNSAVNFPLTTVELMGLAAEANLAAGEEAMGTVVTGVRGSDFSTSESLAELAMLRHLCDTTTDTLVQDACTAIGMTTPTGGTAGIVSGWAWIPSAWAAPASVVFETVSFPIGTYKASVGEVSGRYLISSVGTVGGVQRTATAEVVPPITSALSYILCGGSDIDLKLNAQSTATIKGNIYAAGRIDLGANVMAGSSITIQNSGNVYAGGMIGLSGGNMTYGSLNPFTSTVVGFPTFNFGYYQSIAQANSFYYNGDQTFSSANPLPASPAGGVIFVNGDILISDAQTSTVCLIATGNVTISKGTTTISQYSNYPAMMTQNGNITISSTGASAQGSLKATGLVYSGNNFSISGNHNWADITGSIIARGSLQETGTQCGLTMTYQQQNPPGMTTSGASAMTVRSYNQ